MLVDERLGSRPAWWWCR